MNSYISSMCTYRHQSIVFGSADGKKQHHETKILFVPHFHKLTDATKKKKKNAHTCMHASVNVHTRMRTHTHRYIQFFKHVFLSWLCHVTKILRSLPLFFSYSFCPPSLNGLSLSFPSLFQLITWLSQFSYQFSFHLFLNSVHSQKHVMCDRLFTMNPSHCIMCTSTFYKCSEHMKEIWPPQWRLRLCVQLLRKSYIQEIYSVVISHIGHMLQKPPDTEWVLSRSLFCLCVHGNLSIFMSVFHLAKLLFFF